MMFGLSLVRARELRDLRALKAQIDEIRELDRAIEEDGSGLDFSDDGDCSYHYCYVAPMIREQMALIDALLGRRERGLRPFLALLLIVLRLGRPGKEQRLEDAAQGKTEAHPREPAAQQRRPIHRFPHNARPIAATSSAVASGE